MLDHIFRGIVLTVTGPTAPITATVLWQGHTLTLLWGTQGYWVEVRPAFTHTSEWETIDRIVPGLEVPAGGWTYDERRGIEVVRLA